MSNFASAVGSSKSATKAFPLTPCAQMTDIKANAKIISPQASRRKSPTFTCDSNDIKRFRKRGSENTEKNFKLQEGDVKKVFDKTWRLLFPVFLENAVNQSRRLIIFVFLRTTIECGHQTPDDFDRNSSDWSGSRYCNDRCKVAEQAQFIKGIADGVEQSLKFFVLPVLGVISDAYGRNFSGAISLIGLFLSIGILGVAAELRKGNAVVALVIISSAIEGATEAFNLVVSTSISDLLDATRLRGFAYAALEAWRTITAGIAIIVMTAAVVSRNMYDYANVFWGLAIAAAVAMPMPCTIIPETHKQTTVFRWEQASPSRIIAVFKANKYLQYLGVAAFLAIFAVTSITIAPAFVIGAYGWTQTQVAAVLIAIGAFGLFLQAGATKLIARFGARAVARGSLIAANIGLAILNFSPIHPGFFIFGCLFLVVALMAIPAFLALVSRQVPKSKLGNTLGSLSAITIAANAVGSPVYSSIFAAVGSGGDCGNETDNSISWLPWGLATVSMLTCNLVLYQWNRTFPISLDEKPPPAKTNPHTDPHIDMRITRTTDPAAEKMGPRKSEEKTKPDSLVTINPAHGPT